MQSTIGNPADYTWDESTVVAIELKGTTATSARSSVKVSGSTVTITEAGSYRLSGTLSDGQVVVDTDDKDTVRLILNGVTITNGDQAALTVTDAKKVVVILADDMGYGDFGCFSLNDSKHIGAGDGGMLITNGLASGAATSGLKKPELSHHS